MSQARSIRKTGVRKTYGKRLMRITNSPLVFPDNSCLGQVSHSAKEPQNFGCTCMQEQLVPQTSRRSHQDPSRTKRPGKKAGLLLKCPPIKGRREASPVPYWIVSSMVFTSDSTRVGVKLEGVSKNQKSKIATTSSNSTTPACPNIFYLSFYLIFCTYLSQDCPPHPSTYKGQAYSDRTHQSGLPAKKP